VIVPVEYGLKGIIPPVEYIDKLMKHLGKQYYVALQSAAALHGAAHQQPQEFTVITNSGNLRNKTKKDVKINFVTKKNITTQNITQLMTNSGYVNVSTPELTAFDLVVYEKNTGGINRVATILNELAETLNFENITTDFLKSFNVSIIQRLGYLMDTLGYENLATSLFEKAKKAGIKFRKYSLIALADKIYLSDYQINNKWKLIINEEIEIDE
jgi:predicted transcriptional regulator of viral defense system